MQLSIDNIEFSYGSASILKGIKLELERGEFLGIVGPNGSGKTTLMKCINRILTPSKGEIMIDGNDISKMKLTQIAKEMGYVPQNSGGSLSSPTVFEVVMMGRSPHIAWKAGKTDERIVWDSLIDLGIKEYASHPFDELSSGQIQRVLIARAVAQEAKILLLDEPTSNLDIKYQVEVMNLVHSLSRRNRLGICAIVHDLDLAMKYCDKVIMMEEGRITSIGSPADVLTQQNIKNVYGVDVIIDRQYERPHILIR